MKWAISQKERRREREWKKGEKGGEMGDTHRKRDGQTDRQNEM